jgi:hypothetical protein
MSYTYDTYVGPYARCAVERVPTTKLQIACLNAQCKNHERYHDGHSFCPRCGSKIGTVEHTELDFAIDAYDVSEEIDEALCNPGGDEYMRWTEANSAHLWIPNRGMPGRDPHLESREPFSLAEITSDMVDKERATFLAMFEDEIAILIARYGAGRVAIHWGVIQHYS